MKELNFEDAKKILKDYITDSARLTHLYECAKFAEEVAQKINEKGKAKVDSEFLKVCALLHDIGRSEKIPKGEHAFSGGELLRNLGLTKIAKVIETHSHAHEKNLLLGKNIDLIPKSLEQKIITYIDMHIGIGGKRFTPQERIQDVADRKKDDPIELKAIRKAEERILKLVREVEELM